mmetsp:Transcript_6041/g.13343  ORF Transcript_6041/g.13343 Transcript_6041/m.13343 type:complete len:486 (+) Transcript_6041:86-1543(+)
MGNQGLCQSCTDGVRIGEVVISEVREGGRSCGSGACEPHDRRPSVRHHGNPGALVTPSTDNVAFLPAHEPRKEWRLGNSCLVNLKGGTFADATATARSSMPETFQPAQLHSGHKVMDVPSGASEREVRRALSRASQLMQDYQILEAEQVLAETISSLQESGDLVASADFLQHPLLQRVAEYVARYEEAGKLVDDIGSASGFDLVWENSQAELWARNSSGNANLLHMRLLLEVDAPLHQCVVANAELDLQMGRQPLMLSPPDYIGSRHRYRQVVQTYQGFSMFCMEALYESVRFVNQDVGMLVESVKSESPALLEEDLPEASWTAKRVGVDTTNVWIPVGGGRNGTVLVSQIVLDVGFPIPGWAREKLASQIGPQIVSNMLNSANVVEEGPPSANPWMQRLEMDEFGLYAELRKIEAAAAARVEVDRSNMPYGSELTARVYSLPAWISAAQKAVVLGSSAAGQQRRPGSSHASAFLEQPRPLAGFG